MQRAAFLVMAASLTFYACGGDDSTSGGGTDAGTKADSGGSGSDAAVGENKTKCTSFEDMTSSSTVKVTFPTDTTPAQFSPNCIKIKKGTTVTFEGAFANHNLEKGEGDSNTPIITVRTGTTKSFEFNGIGIFGFQCFFHPDIMFGGIQVSQ
jgi:plastocyanin